MTCEGRVLRRSDKLRSSGVGDGCTVQIMNMMRSKGKHRNRENKAEKKPPASPTNQEPVRDQQKHDEEKVIQSLVSCENAEDAVIWHYEETEGPRKKIADLAEGNDSDMEKWIQIYMELTGLDNEQKKTTEN